VGDRQRERLAGGVKAGLDRELRRRGLSFWPTCAAQSVALLVEERAELGDDLRLGGCAGGAGGVEARVGGDRLRGRRWWLELAVRTLERAGLRQRLGERVGVSLHEVEVAAGGVVIGAADPERGGP